MGEGERGSRKPRVLIAEDDPGLAALVTSVLVDAGYEVVVAHDGDRALSLALAERFDLLLTDYLMPGLTGDVVAERARQAWPWLPVLLMTGSLDVDLARFGSSLIRKPFDLSMLLEIIARLIPAPGTT